MDVLPRMDVAADFVSWPPKSVIYGTDFTASAERAGPYAHLMAKRFGAALVVAHAFTISQFAMEVEAEATPGAKSAQRKDLEGALAAAARRFGGGINRVSPVLIEGDPKDKIPAVAHENAPSLIVLGTRGRNRVGRGVIESSADRILRAADGPTLVVGPHVPELVEDAAPIRRVLYATDLSPAAVRSATYAVGIAEEFGADLEALHVVHAQEMSDPYKLSEIRKAFHAALEGAIPRYAEGLFEPKESIEAGSAHTRILEHVQRFKVDLLVLSVRKSEHTWLRERLSAAFNIIAQASCPVITIMG